jgi:hypothetical protein
MLESPAEPNEPNELRSSAGLSQIRGADAEVRGARDELGHKCAGAT